MPDEETPTNASMPMEKYSEDGKILIKGPGEDSDCSYFVVRDGTLIISKDAFSGNGVVEEIILPESIIEIQDYAFQDCVNLKKIELPTNLQVLGSGVFLGCKLLESIKIPEGITEIKNLFHGCRKLRYIHLPESLRVIGYGSFEGTSNLKEITLPDNLEEIGKRAFRYSQIREISLPATLKKLGEEAFQSCLSLQELTIPEGIDKIEGICDDCFELKKVTLPNSIRVIGFKSFYKCGNLREINLPEGLEEIGYNAFFDCINLTTLRFPDSLKEFHSAFNYCPFLNEIIISHGSENPIHCKLGPGSPMPKVRYDGESIEEMEKRYEEEYKRHEKEEETKQNPENWEPQIVVFYLKESWKGQTEKLMTDISFQKLKTVLDKMEPNDLSHILDKLDSNFVAKLIKGLLQGDNVPKDYLTEKKTKPKFVKGFKKKVEKQGIQTTEKESSNILSIHQHPTPEEEYKNFFGFYPMRELPGSGFASKPNNKNETKS